MLLRQQNMVNGISYINLNDEICEGCILGNNAWKVSQIEHGRVENVSVCSIIWCFGLETLWRG